MFSIEAPIVFLIRIAYNIREIKRFVARTGKRITEMKNTIKLGVVGLGNVAVNNYLPFLSRQENVELYCCSRSSEKAKACAARFGIRACATLEELARMHLDAIFILTLEQFHYGIAGRLLEFSPKRLFIEKPLVARNGQADVCEEDFFDALDLLTRAKRTGTEIAINFNYRFFDQMIRLRRMAEARNLGSLRQSSWLVHYACWSHCLDLLRWFGGEIMEVAALNGEVCGAGALRGRDLAAAFTLRNGGCGTIVGTAGPAFELPLYRAVLQFERGTVSFSDLDVSLQIDLPVEAYQESFTLGANRSRWDQYSASFEKSLAACLDSIRSDSPARVSGMDGLRELQFEAALRRSAATGRRVNLEREFPISL